MKKDYIIDHDYHIHSHLSLCSNYPRQTKEYILSYAQKNGLSEICLTDHFWDSDVKCEWLNDFYKVQNFEHISQSLPLPQGENVKFFFGCETDFDKNFVLGVSREHFDLFDFVIIPTTHLHMSTFTLCGNESDAERAKLYVTRLDELLKKDLPFHKIGIAHLTCPLITPNNYLDVIDMVSDADFHRIFAKAARLGVGIELNFNSLKLDDKDIDREFRPYRIAKDEGCKFYFGSDMHVPDDKDYYKKNFENIANILELCEDEKFRFSNK